MATANGIWILRHGERGTLKEIMQMRNKFQRYERIWERRKKQKTGARKKNVKKARDDFVRSHFPSGIHHWKWGVQT